MAIPKLRNKAYLSARALFYLTIQRKCIDDSDKAVFGAVPVGQPVMGLRHYEDDSDLEPTLGIIDRVTFSASKCARSLVNK